MRTYKIRINEDIWRYASLDDEVYERINGADSRAITDTDARLIYFKKSELDLPLVVHELNHAIWHYLCLDTSATITFSQHEEISCEVDAKNTFKVDTKATEMFLKMKGNSLGPKSRSFLRKAKKVLEELWKRSESSSGFLD